jgi:hypothetical protein
MQVATCASPTSVNEDVTVSASWTELQSSRADDLALALEDCSLPDYFSDSVLVRCT